MRFIKPLKFYLFSGTELLHFPTELFMESIILKTWIFKNKGCQSPEPGKWWRGSG
jgi:hypothetical protein